MLVSLYLAAQSETTNLDIEIPEGPKPWTSLQLNNDSDQFQFAIVTDRTGGHRPGVFLDGIQKLNLLQPEFVMSVGDLIEGYTEDLDELNRQWKEFNGFIDALDMPFFYTPGNHDITNKTMEELYLKKYGKTYYHFVYKDVLFLSLNSEDQYKGAGRGTISTPQYEYIKKTLDTYDSVKWTLVFMHQPLWNQESPERWPDVEKLLSDRKHTVFVGHVHHYAKYDRNNGKYFTLGTTGGGSSLRGPQMGEFDHVTWVTMTENGPILANLQLEGIWDENVSTEKTRDYALGLIRSNPVQIEPLFVDADAPFQEGSIQLKITNDQDIPMHIQLKESFSWDLKGGFDQQKLEIAPNSVELVQLNLEAKKAKPANSLKPMKIKVGMHYEGEGIPGFEVPMSYYVKPEAKYQLKKTTAAIQVDGQLTDWTSLPYEMGGDNLEDGSAKFNLAYDDNFIYIAAEVMDDQLDTDPNSAIWNQDYIGFVLNADPTLKSAMDRGNGWYRESIFSLQAPSKGDQASISNNDEVLPEGSKSICLKTEKGYILETAIPMKYIKEKQGENWKSIRFNMVLQDKDPNEKNRPRYLHQPDWRGKENRVGSGMFFREAGK